MAESGDDWEMDDVSAKGPKNKKLSVERIYQKKTQLEHILLRPDTYIGSVEPITQTMWVYHGDAGMVNREVTYVPGLYKIFDEILVNASDNKQRDKSMDCIKIEISPEKNKISIWNNGQGIPIVEHKDEKMFVPSLIFGHLLTSSNYDDSERKVTGGRNGYGAKLCNIFSSKFTVETASKQYGKQFKQTWTDNMGKTQDPKIVSFKGTDYTCVTFYPDLSKFKMTSLDDDIVAIMTRRAYDIAACSRGVKVFLNDKRLPIKNFKDYIELYLKNKTDDYGDTLKIVHEIVNERWEIAVTQSTSGYQHISFVNSIATLKGGRHVDYITDQVVSKLNEVVKKRNKGGKDVRPGAIKSHLWVFVNCLIENPTFDSQTKENMTLQIKNFGSKCQLTDKFNTSVLKCGIVESIMSWIKFKNQTELEKKCSKLKKTKLKGIPKLEDANDAGTKQSIDCTLILTEGDSAKSLAVSGLGVVGRDKFGVFPLKGKMLNVREATHKQILENAEINNIIKIMGLQYKKKYESEEDLKTLRYGRLMIMTDQDQDGSHIKGLIINFIHHNWPSLLRLPFLEEFITPIVKASKGKEEKSFYSLPEFEEWKAETPNWNKYKVKYYKGLGTSTSKEAKEYFSDMNRHRIRFHYTGNEDDNAIQLAFSKKMVDMRKEWLTNGMEERKRRRELGLPELYLYGKNTAAISYNEFVHKELILFSNMDNERSIPSAMDGLKPGQRKVIYTTMKRNDKREVKVAQLVGSVAEQSAYHHGEAALCGTIIGLAQNFVGSNNINLLQPIGQFGTRLQGGKDAASPRYIFTMLSTVTKHLFSALDNPLLNFLFDDNQKIEPEYYVPIIPMVLVNGAEGIGTGWSTKVPNFNPRDIARNLIRMLDGDEPELVNPWYKNFRGTIQRLDSHHFLVSGEVAILDDNKIEITELPIRSWTQAYKENVLEPMVHGTEKVPSMITDYKEYNTDSTVRFVVTMNPDKFTQARNQGLHKFFKLQTSISCTGMVLFDSMGCIRKYDSPEEILKEYYDVRLKLYDRRKTYMVDQLKAECLKLKNQARFILEKIENKISIENRKKVDMIKTLIDKRYDSDPVKAWKDSLKTQEEEQKDEDASDTESQEAETSGPDYDYLLGMTLWSLTQEKKDELLKKRDEKIKELDELERKTPSDLWKYDLKEFLNELDKVEQQEREDELSIPKAKGKKGGKGAKKTTEDYKPSIYGERVTPAVDEEYKKKWEKKVPKAPGEPKRERKKKADVKVEDDDNKDISLSERIKKGKGGKAMKQTTLTFTSVNEKKPKKSPKKKGRNPWSDSESGSEKSDFSDAEMPEDYIPPEKREVPRRATKAKATYSFAESDEDNPMKSSESEAEANFRAPSPVVNQKPAVKNENQNGSASPIMLNSDDDSSPPHSNANEDKQSHNDLFDSLLGGQSKPPASPPVARNAGSDSDSSGFKIEVQKPQAKKRPRKKEDSGSEDDFKPKAKKEAPAKEKKAPAKKKAPPKEGAAKKPKAKPKKKAFDDSDADFDDLVVEKEGSSSPPPPREPLPGRKDKAANFKFDSDSNDSDF